MEIKYKTIMFGADPEFFFSKKGSVVGSEKVLPKAGIAMGEGKIIIDGVQAEFNVAPSYCRQIFAKNLIGCFARLKAESEKVGVKPDFSQTIKLTKKEMDQLSPDSQQFGCSPSNNTYEETGISIKDASQYMYRSAGGHIHMGAYYQDDAPLFKRKELVKLLDILLGNTCVLIDRDPGNVERRKVYGRAGEYRLPPHGLEYRTLSNFWLRDYKLMSFVLGMTRFAVCVSADENASQAILNAVDMKSVRLAINNNDFNLAQDNFNAIRDIVSGISGGTNNFPLQGGRMKLFEKFVEKGIDHYILNDPMTSWLHPHARVYGWESFLENFVQEKKIEAATHPNRLIIHSIAGN